MPAPISADEFERRLYAKRNDVLLLERYTKSCNKLWVLYPKCGHTNQQVANNLLSKNRKCMKCIGKKSHNRQMMNPNDFKKEVHRLTGNDYTVIGNYYNCDTPILMRHNTCGRLIKPNPYAFLHKEVRCTCVQRHKGEVWVGRYLDNNWYSYEVQKGFISLYDKTPSHPLTYDFWLPFQNIVIEYQGEQHYRKSKFSNKVTDREVSDRFARQKLHDKMKKDYCYYNNIYYVQVPYTSNTYERVKEYLDIVIPYIINQSKKTLQLNAGSLSILY